MDTEWIHIGVSLAVLAGTALLAFIGLKIKAAQSDNREAFIGAITQVKDNVMGAITEVKDTQAKVKEELIASQNEMKRDMDGKHSENRQDIATHAASDDVQFKYIGQTLADVKQILLTPPRSRRK